MKKYSRNQWLRSLVLLSILSCNNNSNLLLDKNSENSVQDKVDSSLTEMQFIKPYIEVGNVHQGDTAKAKFYFVNTGRNKLIIDYINPDSNCTSFFINNERLNPGDTGFVVLKVKAKEVIGKSKVSAVVSANTILKLYKITLEANITNDANEKKEEL